MSEDPSTAIEPRAERVIDFYGDPITVALVDEEIFVPIRPLCDYLGLTWSGQYERLKRDPVLDEALRFVRVTRTNSPGGDPHVLCLPLEFLPGWLFGINVARVKPALKDKITRYRRECFRVLWRAFQDEAQSTLGRRDERARTAGDLVATREMGFAIAHMAEQQMVLEHRITEHDARLDRAATVIQEVQRRLLAVEQKSAPAAEITDDQAADIANAVRAIATELTARDKSKNHYQSVFGELYRRFRVSSYKRVRQAQLADVMAFLEEWHSSVQAS